MTSFEATTITKLGCPTVTSCLGKPTLHGICIFVGRTLMNLSGPCHTEFADCLLLALCLHSFPRQANLRFSAVGFPDFFAKVHQWSLSSPRFHPTLCQIPPFTPSYGWRRASLHKKISWNGLTCGCSLLVLIANDCYKTEQYMYAAKAFDLLEKMDDSPEYWEGKRGACIGVFQHVISGKERKESLLDVLALLQTSNNLQVRTPSLVACWIYDEFHGSHGHSTYINDTGSSFTAKCYFRLISLCKSSVLHGRNLAYILIALSFIVMLVKGGLHLSSHHGVGQGEQNPVHAFNVIAIILPFLTRWSYSSESTELAQWGASESGKV